MDENTTGSENVPKFHMVLHAKINPSNKYLWLRKKDC